MDDMNYAVLRTNPDGGSHFADRLAGLRMAEHVPAIPLVDVGKPMPVNTLTVCRCGAHYVSDPHPPAHRQFAVMLQAAGGHLEPGRGSAAHRRIDDSR
jgi:hypothetical protein